MSDAEPASHFGLHLIVQVRVAIDTKQEHRQVEGHEQPGQKGRLHSVAIQRRGQQQPGVVDGDIAPAVGR